MARGPGKKKGKKKNKAAADNISDSNANEGFIWVDPCRVRFQHSKIRPHFSGCGRSIHETLESIRNHEISPMDLPLIQVIVGPDTEEGPWYFSLNNRRLWVLKRCREEGLLENNLIKVRVRAPKSTAEASRYSLENCALEAKVMKESSPSGAAAAGGRGNNNNKRGNNQQKKKNDCEILRGEPHEVGNTPEQPTSQDMCTGDGDRSNTTVADAKLEYQQAKDLSSDDDSDDDSDQDGFVSKNPFSALL